MATKRLTKDEARRIAVNIASEWLTITPFPPQHCAPIHHRRRAGRGATLCKIALAVARN